MFDDKCYKCSNSRLCTSKNHKHTVCMLDPIDTAKCIVNTYQFYCELNMDYLYQRQKALDELDRNL